MASGVHKYSAYEAAVFILASDSEVMTRLVIDQS